MAWVQTQCYVNQELVRFYTYVQWTTFLILLIHPVHEVSQNLMSYLMKCEQVNALKGLGTFLT